jgi:hypothetical protein
MKPSLPISPVSTLFPSDMTFRIDATPLFIEEHQLDQFTCLIQNEPSWKLHELHLRKNYCSLTAWQGKKDGILNWLSIEGMNDRGGKTFLARTLGCLSHGVLSGIVSSSFSTIFITMLRR